MRNLRIPVTISRDFTTVEDNQDRVIFKVVCVCTCTCQCAVLVPNHLYLRVC